MSVRRASRFTQADVARAIKAAKKENLEIACIRIEPDGSILLIPGSPIAVSSLTSPNPWDE